MIHAESLMAVGGEIRDSAAGSQSAGTLRSPGLLQKHYSPKAKLWVWDWKDEADLRAAFNFEP